MKKSVLILSSFFLSISMFAQWIDNGSTLSTPDNVILTNSNSGSEVKLHIRNTTLSGYSVIRFGDLNSGNGKAYLHRFNSGWTSNTAMWEASSIGFYESIGSMNIGGKSSFKVFTGNNNSERLRINDQGYVGIGTTNPDGHLNIVGTNGATQVKIHLANKALDGYSVIRFSDIDGGSGKAYIHRFNSSWVSGTAMWEANSIGFYESIGSMNIGGKSSFKVFTGDNNSERLRIDNAGNVGIGTINIDPSFKLSVNGSIRSKEVKVEANWSDFVFYDNYELRTLEEVEQHINEKGHLPEIPSESEVSQNGINLGEMNAKLLQKIEELTLYVIDTNKRVNELEKENQELKEEISTVKSN